MSKRVCVIIPTYNNERTLLAVIDSVLEFAHHLIVINDGSTDATAELLASRKEKLHILTHATNRGMGAAILSGLREARRLGFDYAITLDSDGQHSAADIPKFLDAIQHYPEAIIIGNRFDKRLFSGENAQNMRAKSKFANRFSNFWFTVQTGIKLDDTQTGFRAYPLDKLHWLNCITPRYEAQLEFMVYAAWHNVEFVSIPVQVYYAPKDEYVSHFRPLKDFLRISLLNTILTTVAFLYAWPYKAIKFLLELLVLLGLFLAMVGIQGYLLIYFNWRCISERERLWWHRKIQIITGWLVRHIPRVQMEVRNPHAENFETPGILIANHASMFDLLAVMGLSPKLIVLTKRKRMWYNPLYGIAIRYAEFLPIRDHLAQYEDKLRELVQRGYTIVIFPEGVRSESSEILRFKQGAFYLALRYGLELIPVYIHGTRHVLGRHKKLVSSGKIVVDIKPRIDLRNGEYGTTSLEVAKNLRARYKQWQHDFMPKLEI